MKRHSTYPFNITCSNIIYIIIIYILSTLQFNDIYLIEDRSRTAIDLTIRDNLPCSGLLPNGLHSLHLTITLEMFKAEDTMSVLMR